MALLFNLMGAMTVLTLVFPVKAQNKPPSPEVDPQQIVPSAHYRNVFTDTPSGVEQGKTDWKLANDKVGEFRRGHIDILKKEEADAAKSDVTKPPKVSPPRHQH
jgi:hypothetical protein